VVQKGNSPRLKLERKQKRKEEAEETKRTRGSSS